MSLVAFVMFWDIFGEAGSTMKIRGWGKKASYQCREPFLPWTGKFLFNSVSVVFLLLTLNMSKVEKLAV